MNCLKIFIYINKDIIIIYKQNKVIQKNSGSVAQLVEHSCRLGKKWSMAPVGSLQYLSEFRSLNNNF